MRCECKFKDELVAAVIKAKSSRPDLTSEIDCIKNIIINSDNEQAIIKGKGLILAYVNNPTNKEDIITLFNQGVDVPLDFDSCFGT